MALCPNLYPFPNKHIVIIVYAAWMLLDIFAYVNK